MTLYQYDLEREYKDQYNGSSYGKKGFAFDSEEEFDTLSKIIEQFKHHRNDQFFYKLDQLIGSFSDASRLSSLMNTLERLNCFDAQYSQLEASFTMLLNDVLSSRFTDLLELLEICRESYLLVSLGEKKTNKDEDVEARLVKISDFINGHVTLQDIGKWREDHESKQKDTDRGE